MCDEFTRVRVVIPADLSYNGRNTWKWCKVDSCISGIVFALQSRGVNMRGSCCGHGKRDGHINLQDGRTLIIKQGEVFPKEWKDEQSGYKKKDPGSVGPGEGPTRK